MLGMELYTEIWFVDVSNTLVTAVVGVDEQLLPASSKRSCFNGVAMILRGDVASTRDEIGARNVHSSVAKLHLLSLGARGSSEKLVTKTDSKDGRSRLIKGYPDMLNSLLHHSGISRTIRYKESIILLASQLWEIIVPRNDLDLDTTSDQAAQLVVLETNIDANDAYWTARRMLQGCFRSWAVGLRFFDRHYIAVRNMMQQK